MSETCAQNDVQYRDVSGFPGYRVGSDGSVWTSWSKGRCKSWIGNDWKPLRQIIHGRDGYCMVVLYRDHKQFNKKVHTLVLEAFVGPRPEGMQACHYPDHDKTNNRLDNLRWDTQSNNLRDRDREIHDSGKKRCRGCSEIKPFTDFYKHSSAIGRRPRCKACESEKGRLP